MDKYTQRLNEVIPGGAHTYSRGTDQYSSNTPGILSHGKGAYVFSEKGEKYLDYGMALRAVNLGYANAEVNEAAIAEIEKGNNLTRPSLTELQAAEVLVDLIDSVDMVKFTKNGSTAVSAAVKLSRAYTNRTLVARCLDHPFFSYDDWFIGSTVVQKGVPEEVIRQTMTFNYNDIDSLRTLFEKHPTGIACVVLEPSAMLEPCASKEVPGENFLHDVKRLCQKHGTVFILDEMITGFRWHVKGAQHHYKVTPDLCTFGKAMGNGFAVAAIAGKKEIMNLGGILQDGQERVFLLSTTHGAEMCGLGAFIKTVEILKREPVVDHLWDYGRRLLKAGNDLAQKKGLGAYVQFDGIPCSPFFNTLNKELKPSFEMRTLFQQEMVNNGVMMPWLALSYSHGETEMQMTLAALEKTFTVYAQALESGHEKFLKGRAIRPVFRKYN